MSYCDLRIKIISEKKELENREKMRDASKLPGFYFVWFILNFG